MGLFNFISKSTIIDLDGVSININNKRQAQFYAEQFLKHCYESTNLVNKTKTPHVFFERYDYLIEQTENLAKLEIFLKFSGRKPSSTLMYLKKSKEKETNTMIGRAWEDLDIKLSKLKTTKGKENAINKLMEEFQYYLDKMTQSNIELCTSYYNTFIGNI